MEVDLDHSSSDISQGAARNNVDSPLDGHTCTATCATWCIICLAGLTGLASTSSTAAIGQYYTKKWRHIGPSASSTSCDQGASCAWLCITVQRRKLTAYSA